MILALSGGVGGAKLASGLARLLKPSQLAVVVNTADDLELHGLHISPDLDTVMYTLAGCANRQTGWGVAGDTFGFIQMLKRYGEPWWFKLGDRDIATHVLRTQMLRSGMTLTQATAALATALGIECSILPMTDDRVRTKVTTPRGEVEFQDYFVKHHAAEKVLGVRYDGVESARPTELFMSLIRRAEAIIFCPSNPIVSINPILALSGVRDAVRSAAAKKVAVSPIVAGRAIRGPAAGMMKSLGLEPSAIGVARAYADILDVFVTDFADAQYKDDVEKLGISTVLSDIVMRSQKDRVELAQTVLSVLQESCVA